MSRPKPKVMLEYVDKETYKAEQVLEAAAVYAVFYNGVPINIRLVSHVASDSAAKYRKTSYSSSGHAISLAKRLNKLFGTDKFTAHKLVMGKQVD